MNIELIHLQGFKSATDVPAAPQKPAVTKKP